MELFQKLIKNGSSTQITVPVPMMQALGWRTGEPVLLTMTEDGSLLVQRMVVDRTRRAIVAAPAPFHVEQPA